MGFTSDLLGPGGHGWRVPEGARRVLVVGGGIGVPPVLCLARELAEAGVAVDACVGSATAAKLVGVEDFEALGAGEVCVATDDGTAGLHGFCTESAAELLSSHEYDYVATCGPGVMMEQGCCLCGRGGRVLRGLPRAHDELRLWCMQHLQCRDDDGMQGACMCGPVFDATKVVVW